MLMADSLLVEESVFTSPLSSGTPVLKLIGPVHAPTVSEFICVSVLWYLEDTIFLDSSITPGSSNLSLPHRFLSPEVRT